MSQFYTASQLIPGLRVEGHFFGRGFRGVTDGLYAIPSHGVTEVHIRLEAPIKVEGRKLNSLCLWLDEGCEMHSPDGKALIGAVTTVIT